MQYWREEQSPRGVRRGCCRLLRQEKEGNSLDIQRQQGTTSLDIPLLIASESRQSPDLCRSRPIKISRTPTSNGSVRSSEGRSQTKTPRGARLREDALPLRRGVRECRLCRPPRSSHLCRCGRAAAGRLRTAAARR